MVPFENTKYTLLWQNGNVAAQLNTEVHGVIFFFLMPGKKYSSLHLIILTTWIVDKDCHSSGHCAYWI